LAELFRSGEHEPLAAEEWDESRAERGDPGDRRGRRGNLRREPLAMAPRDGEEDEDPNDVYFGGAGGHLGAPRARPRPAGKTLPLAFIDRQRRPSRLLDEFTVETSYSFGELGIDLAAISADRRRQRRRPRCTISSSPNPTPRGNELMVGTPGSMLAAEAMLAWTVGPALGRRVERRVGPG
jgi:hypothetical protein